VTLQTGLLSGVSVSHHHGGIDEIDAVSQQTQAEAVDALVASDQISEAFVLQTCNRAEAFVVTEEAEDGVEILSEYVDPVSDAVVERLSHDRSLRHLMRVSAGLESLVIGEDQILGQLRGAYEAAKLAGGIGPVLDEVIVKAIRVGERARTETRINEGVTSLGSAAVRLSESTLSLAESDAVVIGAGQMGAIVARALAVAESLSVPATTGGLEQLPAAVDQADLVITATSAADHLLSPAIVGSPERLLVIDLAQPRDVDPAVGAIDGVELHDLDTLNAVTAGTRERRRAAAVAVERIIDEEFENLMTQFKRKRADAVIAAMYEGAERTKRRELSTAIDRLEAAGQLTEEQRAVVDSLADALVGQLLAPPTQSLRDAAENDDWATISTALRLFGPGLELEEELQAGARSVESVLDAMGMADEHAEITEEMQDRIGD
jgi:glutamyl-tRNA reductase